MTFVKGAVKAQIIGVVFRKIKLADYIQHVFFQRTAVFFAVTRWKTTKCCCGEVRKKETAGVQTASTCLQPLRFRACVLIVVSFDVFSPKKCLSFGHTHICTCHMGNLVLFWIGLKFEYACTGAAWPGGLEHRHVTRSWTSILR